MKLPSRTAAVALGLPSLPRDDDGPVFAEVWHAEAFALAVTLIDAGLFTWQEWASTLSNAIDDAQGRGDPDLGDTYYAHWLVALETLCQTKHALDKPALDECTERWSRAYERTPHGLPVDLAAADRS